MNTKADISAVNLPAIVGAWSNIPTTAIVSDTSNMLPNPVLVVMIRLLHTYIYIYTYLYVCIYIIDG